LTTLTKLINLISKLIVCGGEIGDPRIFLGLLEEVCGFLSYPFPKNVAAFKKVGVFLWRDGNDRQLQKTKDKGEIK
jgi:hypothetical protein